MQIDDELTQKLEAGVKIINDQHKRIFDFTTDLFAHCVGNEEEENQYFGETIEDAVDLITAHFQTEEDLMLETKFDVHELIEHKKEHGEFVMTVAEYIKRFHETGEINLLTFAGYAKWWVISHIKHFDRRYVDYFNHLAEGKGIELMQV